jgi:2-amino-4-hydroxy-6-hydroxymethyldihydropteridine diphosphokinase
MAANLPRNKSNQWDEAVILALGGNMPSDYRSPDALLEAAVSALPEFGLTVIRRSSLWRSAAWPDPTEPEFVNLVVLVATALPPRGVLDAALELERRFGRRRSRPNAPRTLDVDLIAYGRQVIDEPGLAVPHPRAHQRRFVMGPLAEIAPDWRHPLLLDTPEKMAAAASVGVDARPIQGRL